MADVDALVAFLRARLDEDEQSAREAVHWDEGCSEWADAGEPDWVHIARHDPARVLAEVDAKRRIIEQMSEEAAEGEYFIKAWREGSLPANNIEVAIWTLLTLAQPYADHPDYREEWRP